MICYIQLHYFEVRIICSSFGWQYDFPINIWGQTWTQLLHYLNIPVHWTTWLYCIATVKWLFWSNAWMLFHGESRICHDANDKFVFKLFCQVNPHREMPLIIQLGAKSKNTVYIFTLVSDAALCYCFKSWVFGFDWIVIACVHAVIEKLCMHRKECINCVI